MRATLTAEVDIDETRRQEIIESGPVYLADGMRATLAGIRNSMYCTVSSLYPGLWACSWPTAAEVVSRPDRRFLSTDIMWRVGEGWLGVTPGPADYQTIADYEAALAAGKVHP